MLFVICEQGSGTFAIAQLWSISISLLYLFVAFSTKFCSCNAGLSLETPHSESIYFLFKLRFMLKVHHVFCGK